MLNTGNLFKGMVAPSSATGLLNKQPVVQTTTPQVAPQVAAAKPAPNVGSTGLIPLAVPNGNADAIAKIHTATLNALNKPAPQTNTGSTFQDPLLAGMGKAKTPAQIAADNQGSMNGPGSPAPGTGYTQPTDNAPQGPAPFSATNVPSFGGLIGSLAGLAQNPNPEIQKTIDEAAKYKRDTADALATVGNTPGPLGNQLGFEANINTAASAQNAALQEKIAALEGLQSLQQGGFQKAASLAAPSGTFPFAFNPLTGQFSSASGQNLDVGTAADQLARQVISGKMTYADAVNSIGYAGSSGQQFLNAAIQKNQPDFNFAQAQALGTTQGQVAPQLNMAQTALTNLQNVFQSVPGWQATGIPALNSAANLVSGLTGFGLGTEQEKQNALNEARTQVANALGVMMNTTPTAWTATVQSWFPDNATPAQVASGIQQFSVLAQNRQNIYGAPGQVQPFSSSQNQNAPSSTAGSGSGLFDW